jgi:3-isopropylmalate/(R)-2-methylmalate dehydratase large subunit
MPSEAAVGKPQTLFEKVWGAHVVRAAPGEPTLLYIDLHLVHEVTSPQAFEGLRLASRKIRRPDLTFATIDHNIPTTADERLVIKDQIAAQQIATLRRNCQAGGIPLFDVASGRQGIVHVIGPELGLTQPGMTVVCGDSHTSTHGAFGALAFGIGTSEVEHVLATQCVAQRQPHSMRITVSGALSKGTAAKDLILHIIARLGTDGGMGHVIEYAGEVVRGLSMEERMTLCNMSIECGARAGMVAPDETTFRYLKGRAYAPRDSAWSHAVEYWRSLSSDPGAGFDCEIQIDAERMEPAVTWGTNPGMSVGVTASVPVPDDARSELERRAMVAALDYMGLKSGTRIEDIAVDRVFIGSCTNGRLEDLRAAAAVLKGHRIHSDMVVLVVPGSEAVKQAAEEEGLDRIFKEAGAQWREPGCSMCLGMNPDILQPKQRCASTSNRNFEGRQGREGRTHLVSPETAAATAVAGHFVDVRGWSYKE